jgi:hypothetical protein
MRGRTFVPPCFSIDGRRKPQDALPRRRPRATRITCPRRG